MDFLLVNDMTYKPMSAFCGFCHVEVTKNYLREISTGIVYHTIWCLAQHRMQCIAEIDHVA